MNPQERADALIKHSVGIRRRASDVERALMEDWRRMVTAVYAALATLNDGDGVALDPLLLPGFEERLSDLLGDAYDRMVNTLSAETQLSAEYERDFQYEILFAALGGDFSQLDNRTMFDIIRLSEVEGLNIFTRGLDLEEKHYGALSDIVRTAVETGQTLPELLELVALGGFALHANWAATWARSNFTGVISEIQDAILRINSRHIGGVVHLSTLDAFTTKHICIPRHGLVWRMVGGELVPDGHEFNWLPGPGKLHYNCRSVASYFLEGEEPPQVESGEEWLTRQGDEFVRELFGQDRARMYLEGSLSLRDMISRDGSRLLTLPELQAFDRGILGL